MDELTRTLRALDQVAISRRTLLGALGLAAMSAPLDRVLAQGSCAGRPADDTAQCEKTPFPPPFEPTGWQTVLLDHFTMSTPNPRREAAYYTALMGWKVRSDDGNEILMDIGDWGGVLITQSPPAPPAPPPAPAAAGGGGGRGGRGGGRGGRGGPRATWNGFAWGISPWNTRTVEAELRRRNLDPVAYNRPGGFESFLVHDPDGFPVWITNGSKENRRTTPANGRVDALPFEPTGWRTTWLDHISQQCTSYKESVAWYEALLGWKGTSDEGSQNTTNIGDIGGTIIRGGNANAPGGLQGGRGGGAGGAGAGDATGRASTAPIVRRTTLGHISFGIMPWPADATVVKAELEKRGLTTREDTGGAGPIATAPYKSYHTTTPDNFDLQISNVNTIAMRNT